MESERKEMDRRQFFHLRFKGEANEKECSRPAMVDGDPEGTETFMATHETEPMGGATIVYMPTRDGSGSRIGIALCSDTDNFVKEDGRRKALENVEQKECALIVLEHFDNDPEPVYKGQDAEARMEKHLAKIASRKRHFHGIASCDGAWKFDRLMTSDEAIEIGKKMIHTRARRVMERKVRELDEFKEFILQALEVEKQQVINYGNRCLTDKLEVKSKKARKMQEA